MTNFSDEIRQRNRIEEAFHDDWASKIQVDELLVPQFFEAPTATDNQYVLGLIGDVKGKHVLDLGCGAGEAAVYFAKKGASASGVDISGEMIRVAQRLAEKHGVKVDFQRMAAEALQFPDSSFDIVYGYGALHHIDLARSAEEILRVLKKDGLAVFVEPLGYNPVLWVYRLFAKATRTEAERPFFFSQLKNFNGFSSVSHREFWLLSLFVFIYFFAIKRYHPSKIRYWRQVIVEGEKHQRWFRVLKKLDDIVLRLVPPLRYLCWNTVITLKK